MHDLITATGIVATTPRHLVTSEGLPITSFRLASTSRRYDKEKAEWVDADTNWYTITGFRQLAINTVGSINKGDRVLVTGRLRIREWQNGDKSGTTIEIDAEALGHDLSWGTSSFVRSVAASTAAAETPEAADPAAAATDPGQPGADGATLPDGVGAPTGTDSPADSSGRSSGGSPATPSAPEADAFIPAGESLPVPF